MTQKKSSKKRKDTPRTPLGSSPINPKHRMQYIFGDQKLEEINLPRMSSDSPHIVGVQSGNGIMLMNSPLVGSLNDTKENENMVRNALRLAEVSDLDGLVITGNLLYVLVQGWGSQKSNKALVSGLKIDPEKVKRSYPSTITSAPGYESPVEKIANGKLVFVSVAERMDTATDMLREVFVYPNGKPVFGGPKFFTFAKFESDLIDKLSIDRNRVDFFQERSYWKGVISYYKARLRKLNDQSPGARLLRKKIYDAELMLDIIVRLKNAADESLQAQRDIIASYIIRRYEDAVPGAKVISVGDAYLSYGDKKIMITDLKRGESGYTGNQATRLSDGLESFVNGHRPEMIPNVLVGSGMNPVAEGKFVTFQASKDVGDKRMTLVLQMPVCIDAARYRSVIRDNAKLSDPISRLAGVSGFESGAIVLSWHPDFDQPQVKFYSSETLKNRKIFRNKLSIARMVYGKDTRFKLMYFHDQGCNHAGAGDVYLCDCPDDLYGQVVKYFQQVLIEMMLACKAPLLGFHNNGDTHQGANHPYPMNGHPELLNPADLIEENQRIDALKISKSRKDVLRKILMIRQRIRAGIYELDEQVREYVASVTSSRYIPFWLNILQNAKRVGLSFNGTLAIILHIVGNHWANTYKNKNLDFFTSDAQKVTDLLQKEILDALIKMAVVQNDMKILELANIVKEQIKAPGFGPLGEARGSLYIPGHPEWAMLLRHKQGKTKDANRRGRKTAKNEHEAGRLHHINLCGDTHKGGFVFSRGFTTLQTGCMQGEGSFGRQISGAEQNVMAFNFGIPVGGPDCGPIVLVFFDQATIRRYAKEAFPLDRNILFPNAIE